METLVQHLKGGAQRISKIPHIEQLSPFVWRFLGGNPSSYTLSGTNTYLIGQGDARILFDTGAGHASYAQTLKEGMLQAGCKTIAQIIVSHWHHDHLGGVPQVMETLSLNNRQSVVVRKYMPAEDPQPFGQGEHAIDPYALWPKEKFVPLSDGEEIVACNVHLKFLFTPGHANDHVIAILQEENSMFTADNVLGTGTTVFNDLHLYMNSLRLMLAEHPNRLYPGHGPVVEEGCRIISAYLAHRTKRIVQVVELLSEHDLHSKATSNHATSKAKRWELETITRALYVDLDENLIPPAMGNTYQVLASLKKGGIVARKNSNWYLVVSHDEALHQIKSQAASAAKM